MHVCVCVLCACACVIIHIRHIIIQLFNLFFRDFNTKSDTDDNNDCIGPLELSDTNTEVCAITPLATSETNTEPRIISPLPTSETNTEPSIIAPLVTSEKNETPPVITSSTPKRYIDDNEPADGQPSQFTNRGHIMKIDSEVHPLLMGAFTPPKEAIVTCSGICCLTDIVLSPIPLRYVVKSPFMDVSTSSSSSTLTFSPLNPPPNTSYTNVLIVMV